jgi:hypothetical protein
MRKALRFRPSLRDQMRTSRAVMDFYCAAADKPNPLPPLPPKRERVTKPAAARIDGDLEGPVINAVGDLLALHPLVVLAIRQNSGGASYESGGRLIPVWFYKKIKTPGELTITDYWGFLADGRPYALECKRPSWKEPTTPREKRQKAFIDMVTGLGGVGGFVRSVDEAKALLP